MWCQSLLPGLFTQKPEMLYEIWSLYFRNFFIVLKAAEWMDVGLLQLWPGIYKVKIRSFVRNTHCLGSMMYCKWEKEAVWHWLSAHLGVQGAVLVSGNAVRISHVLKNTASHRFNGPRQSQGWESSPGNNPNYELCSHFPAWASCSPCYWSETSPV